MEAVKGPQNTKCETIHEIVKSPDHVCYPYLCFACVVFTLFNFNMVFLVPSLVIHDILWDSWVTRTEDVFS